MARPGPTIGAAPHIPIDGRGIQIPPGDHVQTAGRGTQGAVGKCREQVGNLIQTEGQMACQGSLEDFLAYVEFRLTELVVDGL